jgi:hypothetical protein
MDNSFTLQYSVFRGCLRPIPLKLKKLKKRKSTYFCTYWVFFRFYSLALERFDLDYYKLELEHDPGGL